MKFVCMSMMLAASSLMAADLDQIRAALANRVDEGRKAVGIVVGAIDAGGRQVVARGKVALDRNQEPDGDTVFELSLIHI